MPKVIEVRLDWPLERRSYLIKLPRAFIWDKWNQKQRTDYVMDAVLKQLNPTLHFDWHILDPHDRANQYSLRKLSTKKIAHLLEVGVYYDPNA